MSLLAALYSVLRQLIEGRCFLDNCYPEVVRPGGNPAARRQIDRDDGRRRRQLARHRHDPGIRASRLKSETSPHLDAAKLYPIDQRISARKRVGEMPPGCDCARVVLGKIYPDQCGLYGRACTPRTPIGPCMVSDEGACRIWWSSGVRRPAGARCCR